MVEVEFRVFCKGCDALLHTCSNISLFNQVRIVSQALSCFPAWGIAAAGIISAYDRSASENLR